MASGVARLARGGLFGEAGADISLRLLSNSSQDPTVNAAFPSSFPGLLLARDTPDLCGFPAARRAGQSPYLHVAGWLLCMHGELAVATAFE